MFQIDDLPRARCRRYGEREIGLPLIGGDLLVRQDRDLVEIVKRQGVGDPDEREVIVATLDPEGALAFGRALMHQGHRANRRL